MCACVCFALMECLPLIFTKPTSQAGSWTVCVCVCVRVRLHVCVCSDPPSVFSCNPEQRFHFPVITCIDFPQPRSNTHTLRDIRGSSQSHAQTHTRVHIHIFSCNHTHTHTLRRHTHVHRVCLCRSGDIVFSSSPGGVRLVLTYGAHFSNHTLAGAHASHHILFLT